MQRGDKVVIVYKGEDTLGIVERCDIELDSVLVSLTLSSGAHIQTVRRIAECVPSHVAAAATTAAAAVASSDCDIEEEETVENPDFYDDIEVDEAPMSAGTSYRGQLLSQEMAPTAVARDSISDSGSHSNNQNLLHLYSCSAPPASAAIAMFPSSTAPVSISLATPLTINVGIGNFGQNFAVLSPLRHHHHHQLSASFSFPLPTVGQSSDDPQCQRSLAVTPPSSLSSSFSGGEASSASAMLSGGGGGPLSPRGKCRRIYGVDNRRMWCTQCRWKKACTRFKPAALPTQPDFGPR